VALGIDTYGDGIVVVGVQGVEYPDRGDNGYRMFWRLATKKNKHIVGHSRASGFRSRPSKSEAMSLISMVPATTALMASAMGISTSTVWARVTTAATDFTPSAVCRICAITSSVVWPCP